MPQAQRDGCTLYKRCSVLDFRIRKALKPFDFTDEETVELG